MQGMGKLKITQKNRSKTRKGKRVWEPPTPLPNSLPTKKGHQMARDVIIKLQRPLNDPDAAWFAYDRGKSIRMLIAGKRVPESAKRAMGAAEKGYFNAKADGDQLIIGTRVPDQPW